MQFRYFILIILLGVSCSKDTTTVSGCYVSDEIREIYQEDAYRLLFREIYFDSLHPERTSAIFNEDKVTEILKSIQRIYDFDTPERDTIFNLFNIHTFPDLGMRSIALSVDTSSYEIERLINGEPTGDADFDSIIATYSFKEVTTSLFYPEFNWITIVSDKSWNLIPIWEKLESFDFVYQAGMGGGAVGDGNDIFLERHNNSILLDFSIGWGDCPAGCIYRRHWPYEVYNNCEADPKEVFTE